MVYRTRTWLFGAVSVALASGACTSPSEEAAGDGEAALTSESYMDAVEKCIAESDADVQSVVGPEYSEIFLKEGTTCLRKVNARAVKSIEKVLAASKSPRAGTAKAIVTAYRDANQLCEVLVDGHSVWATAWAPVSLAGCERERERALAELIGVYADLGGAPAEVAFPSYLYDDCEHAFEADRTKAGNDEAAIAQSFATHADCVNGIIASRAEALIAKVGEMYPGRPAEQIRTTTEGAFAAAVTANEDVCGLLTDAGHLRAMPDTARAGALALCRRDAALALGERIDAFAE